MFFWNDSKEKNNKYSRPDENKRNSRQKNRDELKKSTYDVSKVKERKANVALYEDGKEIGRTTVIKKLNEKSGFWTEKNNGEKSSLRLKRENFQTQEDGESEEIVHEIYTEMMKLRTEVDKLNENNEEKDLDHFTVRLNTLEEDFNAYKKYNKEILTLITDALKIKTRELPEEVEEIPEEEVLEEVEEEVIEVLEEVEFKNSLRKINLNHWGEKLYPFGKRRIKYDKDSNEVSFGFVIGNTDYYAYGSFSEDEKGYTFMSIEEITLGNGKNVSYRLLRFPIILEYIHDENESNVMKIVEEEVMKIVEENDEVVEENDEVVEENDEVVEENDEAIEEKVEENDEAIEEKVKGNDEAIEEKVKGNDEVVEEEKVEENDEVVEENDEVVEENDEVIEENDEVIEENDEVVEENDEVIEENDEVVEENDEVVEEEKVEENDEIVEENDEIVEENDEVIEEKVEENDEVVEENDEVIEEEKVEENDEAVEEKVEEEKVEEEVVEEEKVEEEKVVEEISKEKVKLPFAPLKLSKLPQLKKI
jgi:hypothetical protein